MRWCRRAVLAPTIDGHGASYPVRRCTRVKFGPCCRNYREMERLLRRTLVNTTPAVVSSTFFRPASSSAICAPMLLKVQPSLEDLLSPRKSQRSSFLQPSSITCLSCAPLRHLLGRVQNDPALSRRHRAHRDTAAKEFIIDRRGVATGVARPGLNITYLADTSLGLAQFTQWRSTSTHTGTIPQVSSRPRPRTSRPP